MPRAPRVPKAISPGDKLLVSNLTSPTVDHVSASIINTKDTVTINNISNEFADVGDGGDSDEEHDDFLDIAMAAVLDDYKPSAVLIDNIDSFVDAEKNQDMPNGDNCNNIEVINQCVKFPSAPETWSPSEPKNGQPVFSNVDNPGNWCQFTFRPEFNRGNGPYKCHSLPTGVSPVAKNGDGKRVEGGWEFYYDGWKSPKTHRLGSLSDNLFPKSRKGELDREILLDLGLSQKRMQDCDALFFSNYFCQFVM